MGASSVFGSSRRLNTHAILDLFRLNNLLQELLLDAHLAYLSDRAFVFADFIPRAHAPLPDIIPHANMRHFLRIPLPALLSGPIAGGPLSARGDDTVLRRAVSEEYFDLVCPKEERVEVGYHEVMGELGIDDKTEGDERMARWAQRLREESAMCVVVTGGSVFPWWFTGGWQVLSIWPGYSTSPFLSLFAWSPIVTEALYHNFDLLTSSAPATPPSYLHPSPHSPQTQNPFERFPPLSASASFIPGLLAMHIRRGDYSYHCPGLADWGSEYTTTIPEGYTGYPALPDYLDVPAVEGETGEQVEGEGEEGKRRHDAALRHCWPSIEDIVRKARDVRLSQLPSLFSNFTTATASKLDVIYISTNADPLFIHTLSTLLLADGWLKVTSTLDMERNLTPEAGAVNTAVDMAVLSAAEVFIGNGFSSLTSNVVQIRLGAGREVGSVRFW
ncbi:hypothetical protein GGX14DRAFT_380086 [Mycena pura]|uniref:Uncharacterized protein n=1 Tax=Mycena pura TaxID=153505 RepID=A0AAD6XZQ8_9AGAR|nr:hypothetical protein GGX14DRAFT_380086 [Mycena pura]